MEKSGTLPYFLRNNVNFAGISTKDINFGSNVTIQQTNKERIKELRTWANENLVSKEVYHNKLDDKIKFTTKGIKEYLNQPHKFYYEKNEMIKDIQNIIKTSEYMGFVHFKDRISHIFEIVIKGKDSWLIANEYKGRGIILYSISDSPKVLTGIKKNSLLTGYRNYNPMRLNKLLR